MKSKYSKSLTHTTNYLEYINKQGDIFTPDGESSLSAATQQAIQNDKSQAWFQIFSLNYDDTIRLSIDQAYMQTLISAKRDEIAAAYNIKPQNLMLYASWHTKDFHPHLHMVFFSRDTREGFLKGSKDDKDKGLKAGSKKLKSVLANTVFKDDLQNIKVEKSQTRSQLNEHLKQELLQTVQKENLPKHVRDQFKDLSKELRQHYANNPGRKAYMYLPPQLKAKVDAVLESVVENNDFTKHIFGRYAGYQHDLLATYADSNITKAQKMDEWEQRFYHPGKGDDTSRHNIVIQSALGLDSAGSGDKAYRAKSPADASSNLLWGVANNLCRELVRSTKSHEQEPQKQTRQQKEKQKNRQSNISHDDYLER